MLSTVEWATSPPRSGRKDRAVHLNSAKKTYSSEIGAEYLSGRYGGTADKTRGTRTVPRSGPFTRSLFRLDVDSEPEFPL